MKLRSSTCNRSAFTLMELMVVLILVAIMAAVLVPEMKGTFEDALLRSSGRKLVDVFGLAYSRAVSQNQLHRVRLNQSTGQYVIEKQTGEGQEDRDFEPVAGLPGFAGQIDSRIFVSLQKISDDSGEESDLEIQNRPMTGPGANGISFYPDGTAEGCEILLRDRMGVELKLQLDPTTARVRLVNQEQL